jgi:glucosylglycerate phosphorylase
MHQGTFGGEESGDMTVHDNARTDGAPTNVGDAVQSRLRGHLDRLYGAAVAEAFLPRLVTLMDDACDRLAEAPRRDRVFDERDVLLITYGDQLRAPDERPLETLREFLVRYLDGVVSGVHLLPHYPSTSDDGFAVADYLAVDPELGTWRDVVRLGSRFDLMLDAVVNHTSASSVWFRKWARGEEAFRDFFITLDAGTETSAVVRPRTSPLLTPVETARGLEHVWTTFSADQVDLNYGNPEVLLAMCEVLLRYVELCAQILRLDAIAFLWKDLETSCIHLPETHEVVKLWRTMLDAVAPGTLLVTETNVPHTENVTYFGNGSDEAHLVYQFPLAPLTLSAFHLADTSTLTEWLGGLPPPSPQTSFLNFLGCHDGIGLRPAEGLLTPGEIEHLCDLVRAHGGGVGYRANSDGSMSPYELNTVFFDALNPVDVEEPDTRRIDRFVAAHAILLALAGVPLLYINALLGSHNWYDGVRETGRLRSINRQKFDRDEIEAELADHGSRRRRVLDGLSALVRARRQEPAFHPAGGQHVLLAPRSVLALERTSPDRTRRVVALTNVSGRSQGVQVEGPSPHAVLTDLLGSTKVEADRDGFIDVTLPPYGVSWLAQDIG